jgi:arginyl-tRNA synthetase
MAISNLWESIGIKVTRDYIDNDRGIALAKLMWGYLKFAKKDETLPTDINYWYANQNQWKTPDELGQKPDQFVDNLYTQASEDFKNPEIENIVRKFVVDWENEDPVNWALWKLVLEYSHRGQEETLLRLGSKTDKIWHEHEFYKKGKEIVEEGLKNNVFVKLEDGAVLTNLKEYKIPDTVVIKRDGTSLYITQDLALTKLKRETFNPDKLFWVIGPDQSLALKQVFAVCEQMGFGKVTDYTHISFGYVTIKGEGKMSSRKGNVVYIDDLLDDAAEVIKEKISNESLSEEERKDVAEKLGVGAVKYSILKVGRLTDTAFDFNISLSFEGDSAPYLIYTYTRCKSILSQVGNFEVEDLSDVLNDEVEMRLVKHLSKFPEVVLNAALSYSPNLVAGYLYELAQNYNSFYGNLSVLNAENEKVKNARLLLTSAVAQVLQNGLNLLGIETVERM